MANGRNGSDLQFEADLFKAADKLRGNLEPSEYKHVALGLIFLKYTSEAFEAQRAKLDPAEFAAPEDQAEYTDALVSLVPDLPRSSYLPGTPRARAPKLTDPAP